MTLKFKIIAGYLIITLITIIVAIVTIQNYTKVINLYEETTIRYHNITRITKELAYRMLQRQSSLNGFLLTGKTRHLVSYDENILPVKALIRQASELNPTDMDYNSVIAKYEKLIQEWEDKIAEEEKKMRQQLDYGLIGYQQYTASIAEMDREGRSILREFKLVEEKLINIIE
jgi:CHASE3 domain sensor protein